MAGLSTRGDVHRMNNKRFSFLILVAALICLLSSGCRTMEGAGEDIERAGEKIQEKADR